MSRSHKMSIALSAVALGMALHVPQVVRAESPEDPAIAPVDSFLQTQLHRWKIPGLAVAVVRNGEITMARSYGYANVELEAALSPSSVFEIGPASKQFTAAAAMRLVEQGKLWLDAPIRLTMPDLPQSWTGVTLRHLLSHTSGIPNYTSTPGYIATRGAAISQKQILASVAALPLRFEPGTRSLVSLTDYFVVGLLIERASGKSYARFLNDQFFRPLGMASTQVSDYDQVIERRVTGYTLDEDGSLVHPISTHPSRLFGSGGMVSSVRDLARWQAALLTGKALRPATVAQMWTPAKLKDGTVTNYGFGAYIRNTPQGPRNIELGGTMAGFRSQIVHFPSDNTSVIVLTNLDNTPYSLADSVHQIVANSTVVR